MPFGEDYDGREVSFLESRGREFGTFVAAIKIESMAEICFGEVKPKARPRRTLKQRRKKPCKSPTRSTTARK